MVGIDKSKHSGEALYQLSSTQQIYGGRTVLDIGALEIYQGEILALVGPSGAGKSTLLRLLGFLEKPTAGQLSYEGQLCDETWPDLENRRLATMVFQNPQLLRRSVIENVVYGLKIRGQKNGREEVANLLNRLGLTDLVAEMATTLSGGEAQRVALARALVLKPRVLLLDEPTANLDPYNIKLIEDIVCEENEKQQTTVVVVTHNVFQARRLADRVGLLLSGKLVEVTQTERFFTQPQSSQTNAFVRGELIY
ncbi:MAG: ATP-binding cassette domain-containing protein [Candidatus Promineifilaceae bacterium]|nr:ATP-binding cassette domain-containing protein [Candidatus Promineifilaceae bacterium]